MRVREYRCTDTPHTTPRTEHHARFAIAWVRSGSFCYRVRGETHALTPGALLLANRGDDYVCTHEFGCGDECVVFDFSEATLDRATDWHRAFSRPALPAVPRMDALSHLARGALEGANGLGLDELGYAMLEVVLSELGARRYALPKASPRDRDRAVAAASWLREGEGDSSLEAIADRAGLSPFHFLRLFRREIGLTPHQYLICSRVRRAAALLVDTRLPVTEIALESGFEDLSNFIRTFHRLVGVSPRGLREARGQRKILQVARRGRA